MRDNSVTESSWASSSYQGIERDDNGCITLWRAVIDQVVTDFKSTARKTGNYNGNEAYYQKQEAADLIFGYNKLHFDDLCTLACIDPDYLRRSATRSRLRELFRSN